MVQNESNSGSAAVEPAGTGLQFRVLGRMGVVRPTGEVVAVRRAKPATLLAALLIQAGDPITADALVDALWPDAPPTTANKTLQTYVGQIRTLLQPDREPGDTGEVLRTEASSYRLAIEPTAVDAGRFARHVDDGRRALPADPAAAMEHFDEALALWRGPPYPDVADLPFARPEVRRLGELRMAAVEGGLDARLAIGEHAAVVPDLQELTRRYPLREHAWAQLMRALYLSGRQADALAAYAAARDALATELGVDPGPELARAHTQILAGALSPPTPDATAEPTRRPPRAAEQRVVTALSVSGADLGDRVERGFTATIERYGGTVSATHPTAALAVFGVPHAREDDAERAVRCAFALRRWARSTGAPVRIGIDVGDASVERRDAAAPTVHGGPTAVATSLTQHAAPGGVLVTRRCRHTTEHAVRYEAGPAGSWMAKSIVEGPSGRPLSSTPFVGRETELGVLEGLWHLVLRSRRPRLVTVVGPAGIGKSRLVREFGRRLGDRGVRVLTGRAHPVGDATFGALEQVIAELAHVERTASPDRRRARIEEWLTGVLPPEERDRQEDHVVTLLSVLGDVADVGGDTIDSLRRVIEAAAAPQPLVIVFDDLHVAHPTLIELVTALGTLVRGVPLMTVAAARPPLLDARVELAAGPSVPLAALPDADARALAAAAAPDTPERPEGTAGGNPLFIEELARWRTEQPAASDRVPPTIRSAILSRLDRLDDSRRRTIVDAAVVGSRFWAAAVRALADGAGDDVQDALDALELAELIVRQPGSAMAGRRTYAFGHELFADVAYATVPRALRADKHFRLAQWLAGVDDVPPALLAHHWQRARGPLRAADELIAAGDAANRGPHRARAVRCYQQAIDLLDVGAP